MPLRSLVDLPAPAKLNLFLHVVGKRDDGYHRLQSLFALIDWHDLLHVELRDDGRLQRHDLGPALPADDLCLRAARLLQEASGTSLGADISVEKRVPQGAGMGGGSSDAATTLLALNRLWRLDWPRDRLLVLAPRLGADVPFFVGGQNALVEGIGEALTPVVLPPCRFAVVKPAASLETRAIFASALLGRSDDAAIIPRFAALDAGGNLRVDEAAVREARNDLEAAARSVCPEVGDAIRRLEAVYGNGRMTGSGSAVYAWLQGSVGRQDDAIEAEAASAPLPSGWQSRVCRSLEAHPLAGWARG